MDTDNDSTDTNSSSTDTDRDSTDTDRDSTDTDSDSTDTESKASSRCHAVSGTGQNKNAKSKPNVSSIHDLLTLNLRLLSLMETAVSAKSVSVSAENKRRWQKLGNYIEEYAVDGKVKTLILLRFRMTHINCFLVE